MAGMNISMLYIVVILYCCLGLNVDYACAERMSSKKFSMDLSEMNRLEIGIRNAKDALISELIAFSDIYKVSSMISPRCIQDTVNIPIQALDAFGKPRSGILGENFFWLGNFHECTSLGTYQHCVADMQINAAINNDTQLAIPIYWGICMPKSCSEDDIENLIRQANVTFFRLNPSPLKTKDDRPPGLIHCNQIPAKPYNAGFICVVTLSSIIGVLMLLGAAVDVYIRWFESRQNVHGYQRLDGSSIGTTNERTSLLQGTLPEDSRDSVHGEVNGMKNIKAPKQHGFLTKFLLCFAVNRSLDKLLNAKQGDNSIGCLNGIRVLSISWIILAHSLLYPFQQLLYDNTLELVDFIQRLDFTVVVQGEYAVDSFFLLSGCLLAYLSLGKMAKTNGKLPWGLFYFHRIWRLTPVYGAMILFILFVDPYIGKGPLWYRYIDHPNCEKYWWRNLLYISNFFPKEDMCMDWTWYLPNDMQFFAISPFILILLHRVPKVGAGLLSLLTVMSMIIKTSLSAKYSVGLLSSSDNDDDNVWNKIYDKPWTRISPYFVGMALGFLLVRRPNLRMRPLVVVSGWVMASAVGLVVIYVVNNQFYRDWSTAELSVYNGFVSVTWALCLAWVILACKHGYGGWVNTFLSWKFWVPVGRLTYTVYLVHPIIVRNILFSNSNAYYGVVIPMSSTFTGSIVLSHMVALLFALAIEYPFANLEKLLIPSSLQKKYSENHQKHDQEQA